jgi:tyrosyl-tRNA synthetase
VAEAPEKREAQRTLAREVTGLVHGAEEVAKAGRATAVLFGGSIAGAKADDLLVVFEDVPSVTVSALELNALTGSSLAVLAGLAQSKGEAARLIKQGGFYVNDRRVSDDRAPVSADEAIDGRLLVLRKGQRERRLVQVLPG